MEAVEVRLTGGHPNSLGNTVAVVDDILAGKVDFADLFECYSSKDEVVRLRVSNAVKRITKAKPQLVIPYIDRLLNEISQIDQDSTQWTIAQLMLILEDDLSDKQKQQAVKVLKHNLKKRNDWIVLNFTMETLFEWSKDDPKLAKWLFPHLKKHANDKRNSVAKRANKYLFEMK